MPLYLYALLGSLSFPLLFTLFYVDLVKQWKSFLISTCVVAAVFLVWDAYFTSYQIWNFNSSYCIGWEILGMPLEEWLFFFVIPFCSLFIHFALFHYFPNIKLNQNTTRIISIVLIVATIALILLYPDKMYTLVNFSLFAMILLLGLLYHLKTLQQFYLSFILILIPFILVNGLLTGAFTDNPVVSYDNSENMNIRAITIPLEDFAYAFTMLFGNLLLFERLNQRNTH